MRSTAGLQDDAACKLRLSSDKLCCCRVGETKRRAAAHDSSVTGIAADACNKVLVTTGLDGRLCMWDFKQQRLQGEVAVGSAVACMAHHPATSLVALAADDLVLRM